jgi:hypothetical protein
MQIITFLGDLRMESDAHVCRGPASIIGAAQSERRRSAADIARLLLAVAARSFAPRSSHHVNTAI